MKKFLAVLLLSAVFCTDVRADISADIDVDATTGLTQTVSYKDVNHGSIGKELTNIEKALKSKQVSAKDMGSYIHYITKTDEQVDNAKKEIEKELGFAQKRIEALGAEPKEGETESEVITQKRKEFNDEVASLKAKIAEADLTSARIDEINNLILSTRNQALLDNLLDKQPPLIYPSKLLYSTALFVDFFFDIVKSPIDWYQELSAPEQSSVKSNIIPVILIILLSLFIGIYLRSFIMKKFGYRKDIENPRYSTKVAASLFVGLARGVIPACILGAFIVWVYNTPVMNAGFFGIVLKSALFYTLFMFLGKAATRVTFAPYNEKWRLISIDTPKAKRLTSAFYLLIIAVGVLGFLRGVATEASYSIELVYFITTISSALKAFCFVLIIKRFLIDTKEDTETEIEDDEDYEIESLEDEGLSRSAKIVFFVSVFCLAVFMIAMLGYPNLSRFIFDRVIASFLLILLFAVLRKALQEGLHRLLLMRYWVRTFKMRRHLLSRINFWFSMVIDPILFLSGGFILLTMWGVSNDFLAQNLKKLLLGFELGGMKISLLAIVFGIAFFFAAMAAVRVIKRKMYENVLSKMDMEDGIKHSLTSGFGFLGFIISIILALSIMGVNLTNLALIAGALSLGIGLGLQNIVNNFVSGIVLLFERPLKVGDWVNINGQEGVVKQINIRATELETWSKANVIIPNASILSSNLTNMTHKDKWGRIDVKVGVGYDSDIDEVKRILLEIAAENKRILKKPEPYVVFLDFGESWLDFEIRCFSNDIMNNKLAISSELRTEIFKRFTKAGIDIPLPQRVLQYHHSYLEYLEKHKGKKI